MSGAGDDGNGDGGGDAHGGDAMCIVIVLLLLPGLLSRVTHYIIVILQSSILNYILTFHSGRCLLQRRA